MRALHLAVMGVYAAVAACGGSLRSSGAARDAGGKLIAAREVRYVVKEATVRVDLGTMQRGEVLASSYPGLTRATNQNPWDLYDPISKRHVAQYEGEGGFFLWSVGDGAPQKVEVVGAASAEAFRSALVHGVLSADGRLLYLSTAQKAYVAQRQGNGLRFSALRPLGHGVQLVHDVSWDGRRVVVTGHRAMKWGDPTNVVAPRMASVFALAEGGLLGEDLTAEYPGLETEFVQSPHFMADSVSLLVEGDDDIDTGDRLFVLTPGEGKRELSPEAVRERDFNTPCVLPDDRVVFFESAEAGYMVRMYDSVEDTTTTVDDAWYPFSGYLGCR